MALRVELKPGERVIMGDVVIVNDDQRTRLFIEGSTPILREKDIIRPQEADTPCKKFYLAVQLLYLSRAPQENKKTYLELATDLARAAPSTKPFIEAINHDLIANNYYRALKKARKLIEHEAKILDTVKSSP